MNYFISIYSTNISPIIWTFKILKTLCILKSTTREQLIDTFLIFLRYSPRIREIRIIRESSSRLHESGIPVKWFVCRETHTGFLVSRSAHAFDRLSRDQRWHSLPEEPIISVPTGRFERIVFFFIV